LRTALALSVVALLAGCGSHASTQGRELAAVSAKLARLARQGRLSGTVLVAKDGRPVLERAYGIANRATGERNRLDTRFDLASLGKTFTAVAVARRVVERKVRFGDRIGRWLPELPPALRRITVAQLLDHTSGLGDFFASPGYDQQRPRLTSLDRYLPLIAGQSLAASGGFHYSNSGYLLLGLIVERASGERYDDFLRRAVFAPAGMTRSGCFPAARLPAGTAIGYTGPALAPNTSTLPPMGTSAGGCYSTAPDLLRFANALLGDRLLSARLTRTLTTPKARIGPRDAYGYGFGIREGRPGDPPTIWHNGGSPGVGAELDVNGPLGYTIVVLANRDYPTIRPAIDLILDRLHIP
jgi:CubicO group peptidase (beta-lactamase class C family)